MGKVQMVDIRGLSGDEVKKLISGTVSDGSTLVLIGPSHEASEVLKSSRCDEKLVMHFASFEVARLVLAGS